MWDAAKQEEFDNLRHREQEAALTDEERGKKSHSLVCHLQRAVVLGIVMCLVSCSSPEPRKPQEHTSKAAVPTISNPAVRENLVLLQSKDAKTRAEGAARLARMGPVAESAIPALIDALADPNVQVKTTVMLALLNMDSAATSAVPSLLKMVDHQDPLVAKTAAIALKKIQRRERVSNAIQKLQKGDDAARYQAAADLRAEAPDAVEAVPALITALKDSSPMVRRVCVQTLGRIGQINNQTTDGIAALDGDPDQSVKEEAALVQGIFGLTTMAWSQLNNDQVDLAIEGFEKLARHDPLFPPAPEHLGWAYFVQGNFDLSIQWFDRAINLMPRDAESYRGRGKAYHLMGDFEGALFDINRALYLNPNSKDAHLDRAYLYRDQKQYELAVEDARKALKLPGHPVLDTDAHALISYMHRVTGNHAESLADADRALKVDPSNTAALYYKALAHEALGQKDEAAKVYRQFATTPLPDRYASLKDAWLRVRDDLGIGHGRTVQKPARQPK